MTVARVLVVLLLAVVVTRASANVKTYRYIEESLSSVGKEGFRNFTEMANMNYFRLLYPQSFGVSRWPEFLAQQREKDKDLSEDRAIERYRLALFSDPLSNDRLSDVLMQDDAYRAHAFAYAILYGMLPPDDELSQREILNVATASRNVVPLVMAIDGDHSLAELVRRTLAVLQHSFNFYVHQDLNELSNSDQVFAHIGNYLMRSNEIELEDTGKFQATQLRQLGFTEEEFNKLSYRARDAIIISGVDSKAEFVRKSNTLLETTDFDPEAINAVVADIGPLVFVLTSPQYDYALDEINRHDLDELVKIFNFR